MSAIRLLVRSGQAKGQSVMGAYTVGVDYGTESCRAVVFDVQTGSVVADSEYVYPGGVIDQVLPETGQQLGHSWALQDPRDYLSGLVHTVGEAVKRSGVDPASIIAIGVDATACTIVPTDASLEALALQEEWRGNPYAWPRLWKDHSSQPQADQINSLAMVQDQPYRHFYGGKLSSEWTFPKLLKMYVEAPEVFAASAKVLELQDWLVSTLVGNETRGAAVAGYKETYQPTCGGYPSAEFLDELAPGFSRSVDRLGHQFLVPGEQAGILTRSWAEKLGLDPSTVVAAGHLDAHVAVLGVGISKPNEMLLVMGTSACNLMLASISDIVEGVGGIVKDGLVPGYWAYESGQSGVGDTFGWFVRNFVPSRLEREAEERGIGAFALLEQRAGELEIGETGLLSLDWFNGNRSTLQDGNLSGLIVGLTLRSRAEDVYRCLLESAAFGQREIFDSFERSGVPINRLVVTGGIAFKSPLLMQMLADVLNRPVEVNSSRQGPAVGAAMHAAIAGGAQRGGYADFDEAARSAPGTAVEYMPISENVQAYDQLFALYSELYEEFGKQVPGRMHLLRQIAVTSADTTEA